jgi:hypothetical protein
MAITIGAVAAGSGPTARGSARQGTALFGHPPIGNRTAVGTSSITADGVNNLHSKAVH